MQFLIKRITIYFKEYLYYIVKRASLRFVLVLYFITVHSAV